MRRRLLSLLAVRGAKPHAASLGVLGLGCLPPAALVIPLATDAPEQPALFIEAPSSADDLDAQAQISAVFDRRFLGRWVVEDLHLVIEIRLEGEQILITAQDFDAGVDSFVISEVSYSEGVISATFFYPSTVFTTYSTIVVVDGQHLRDSYTGDTSGEDLWTREGG